MKHHYMISGMTCTGCQAKVQGLLSKVKGVKNIAIDLPGGKTTIEMEYHIPVSELQDALKDYPKYKLRANHDLSTINDEETKSWIQIYKPILLIFGYLLAVTLSIQMLNETFDWIEWLEHFMAGFFLVFSFFKLLNLRGFAWSYSMYDIVAKKWPGWGYLYAFVELALGFAFLTAFEPIATNTVTFIVMSVSIVGVLQSVINKRKINCACLGEVFKLPMSTVTIIEDALMILMSLGMLIALTNTKS